MLGRDGLLGFYQLGEGITKHWWWRWWWLVESSGNSALLLVNLFHSFELLVLGNGFQIIHRTVEKSDTDMGSFERSDVVGTVTSHKSSVSEILESVQDKLLLRGRDSGIDPSVFDKLKPRRSFLELFESNSSDTNVVVFKDLLVEWLGGVDGYDLGLIDVSPNELIGGGTLLEIQNHDLSVDNFDVSRNVHSSKRVVSGDHDTLMLVASKGTSECLTLCEESASILRTSTASGLSGQWKTRNPAKSSLHSTSSRVMVLI